MMENILLVINVENNILFEMKWLILSIPKNIIMEYTPKFQVTDQSPPMQEYVKHEVPQKELSSSTTNL